MFWWPTLVQRIVQHDEEFDVMIARVLAVFNSFSAEDSSYVTILAATLLCSVITPFVPRGNLRKWFCTLPGIGICAIVCREQTVHVIGYVIWTQFVTTFLSIKHWKPIIFFSLFVYISCLRLLHVFEIHELYPFSNGVLMILTLKLISVVFDLRDSIYAKRLISQGINDDATNLQSIKMPSYSILDLAHYSFCYIGLVTGPIFTYRTYHDFIYQRFSPSLKDKAWEILSRLKFFILIVPLFLFFARFKASYLHTEEFAETSFLFKIVYMFPLFTLFRLRMYFGWLSSEICFVIAGFGAYPKSSQPKPGHGPTKFTSDIYSSEEKPKYQELRGDETCFETIRNMDVIGTETQLTMQDGIRSWNMCVQWWLVQYTFKQCPIKSLRKPGTFFISALWHGVRSGYFLSFMCVPLLNYSAVIVQNTSLLGGNIKKTSDGNSPGDSASGQKPVLTSRPVYAIFLSWLFTNQYWNYLNMAFYLLSGAQTLKFWSQIYFIHHIVALAIICGHFIRSRARKRNKDKQS